jgi:hypothetical protein
MSLSDLFKVGTIAAVSIIGTICFNAVLPGEKQEEPTSFLYVSGYPTTVTYNGAILACVVDPSHEKPVYHCVPYKVDQKAVPDTTI